MSRIRQHTISFGHALEGLSYVFRTQPNFQVHLIAAIIAIILGVYLQISQIEWLVLVFTIALVLVAETVNTSLESVTDLLANTYKLEAKVAKDVAAGMVLLSCFAAVVIGLLIFIPYLIK